MTDLESASQQVRPAVTRRITAVGLRCLAKAIAGKDVSDMATMARGYAKVALKCVSEEAEHDICISASRKA